MIKAIKYNSKVQVQVLVLIAGFVLLIAKFGAYFITHSNIVLSDALESIVNIVAGAFGLYSLILATKPKDEDHPYGHGKIEFISASIEGTLIILAGIAIILKSIFGFFRPSTLNSLDIGIVIVGLAGLINYFLGWMAENKGIKTGSVTLIASGKHLKTDAYSTIALILGLILILITRLWWIDNLVAITMAIFIIYSGLSILRKSIAGIMDEADFELLESVVRQLNIERRENWVDIHNLRIIKYGDSLHVDCHATIPWYYNVEEAHDEIESIEKSINGVLKNDLESFIHADACVSNSCEICLVKSCKERKHPFKKKIEWTLKNVMQNSKHDIKSI